MESIFLDNFENADWLRSMTWDLPEDVDEFLKTIGGAQRLPNFMKLVAARPMPAALRLELTRRGLLESHD